MNHTDKSRARFQVHRVRIMNQFLETPSIREAIQTAVPVTMPPDEGSLGLDIRFWAG
jgi:hypothetical protein